MPKLLIIVPLYKGPDLVPALVQSLMAVRDEIVACGGRVLLINDSPDCGPLIGALETWAPRLAATVPAEVLVNRQNLGFIGSCNRGFEIALFEGADVLLLNSDCLLTPGAVREMADVARLDPMTSVVSPRSNNATICNSPYPERFRTLGFEEAVAAHGVIQHHLPRVTYVPTAVGFCLYIRHLMIKEFGVFDEIYGAGYNEENDFILRCNRRGYRAVMAKHCFAYHIGNVSFNQTGVAPSERDLKNRAILLERYPEYGRAVSRYFTGVEFLTQTLTAGLVPGQGGKLRLVFDCRNLGPYHNGTFELAVKMIRAFVGRYPDDFEYFVACNHNALVFHGLDKIIGLSFTWNAEQQMAPFAIAVRLAQPFDLQQLVDIAELAPVTCFLVLDTIALDCQNLDDQGLERVWRNMLQTTSMVGYISDYSRDQFQRRFGAPSDIVHFVALCSTNPCEYDAIGARDRQGGDPSILLVGNHYAHKHVADTLEQLRRHPARPPVVVLGVESLEEPGIVGYRAGELDQTVVDRLYDEATVVLFPSHYEGFGFPAMHALARHKPLIARRLPVFEEIAERSPHAKNIHLFDTTEEMVRFSANPPSWKAGARQDVAVQDWLHAAGDLHAAIQAAVARFDFEVLRRRMQHVECLRLLLLEERRGASTGDQASAQAPASLLLPVAPEHLTPPVAPHNDPLRHVGEVASMRIAHLLGRLGRIPLLRQLGASFWRTRRHGRRITISLGEDLSLYGPQSVGAIAVRAADPAAPSIDVIHGLLDWAYRLTPGGSLSLQVASPAHDDDPMNPFTESGLRVWSISAGFQVQAIEPTEAGLLLSAAKAVDWAALLSSTDDDEGFVSLAFKDCLDREATGLGADHALIELRSGAPRYDVLKHLYGSLERSIVIARRYQILG